MKQKVNMHPNFVQYMKDIVNHPNYEGLKIRTKKKW